PKWGSFNIGYSCSPSAKEIDLVAKRNDWQSPLNDIGNRDVGERAKRAPAVDDHSRSGVGLQGKIRPQLGAVYRAKPAHQRRILDRNSEKDPHRLQIQRSVEIPLFKVAGPAIGKG